jgi:hypothetical protein
MDEGFYLYSIAQNKKLVFLGKWIKYDAAKH